MAKKKVDEGQLSVAVVVTLLGRNGAFSKGTLTIDPGPHNQKALVVLKEALQDGKALEVKAVYTT